MKKLIRQKSIPAIVKYALTQMLKAKKKEVKAVAPWIVITSFLFSILITYYLSDKSRERQNKKKCHRR